MHGLPFGVTREEQQKVDQQAGKIALEVVPFILPELLPLKAATETTTIYRAVTEGELKQIQKTGAFEAGENSLGGKWFAETIDHARQWGNVMNGQGASTILEVKLLRSQVNQFFRLDRLDNIGPAVYGELEQLHGAVIKALGK
jgi:hypothetical protein